MKSTHQQEWATLGYNVDFQLSESKMLKENLTGENENFRAYSSRMCPNSKI